MQFCSAPHVPPKIFGRYRHTLIFSHGYLYIHGRVVMGVGHLDHVEVMESGKSHYSRMSY